MERIVRTERRRRGLFGKVFAGVFWLWNGLMVVWLVAAVLAMAEQAPVAGSEAQQAGYAVGATLGLGLILALWAAGAVITGLLSWATRGPLVVVEERQG